MALNAEGHVKFFRANDIAGQLKKVRHCNPCKVEKAGVWWCETDTSAKRLKDRIDVLLKETYTPSPGAGFYQMPVPKQMAQMAVELAAGLLGVVIFSNEEREIWLYDQVKIQSAKAPRGF